MADPVCKQCQSKIKPVDPLEKLLDEVLRVSTHKTARQSIKKLIKPIFEDAKEKRQYKKWFEEQQDINMQLPRITKRDPND